jgi:hypothetical protein
LIAVSRGDVQGSSGESIKVATQVATKLLTPVQMRSGTTPCRRPAPMMSCASSAMTLCRRPTFPLAPQPIAQTAIIDLEAHSFLVRPRVVQLGMKDPKANGMNELVQLACVMAG